MTIDLFIHGIFMITISEGGDKSYNAKADVARGGGLPLSDVADIGGRGGQTNADFG